MLLREWLKEKKHKTSPWGDEHCDRNGYVRSLMPSIGCYFCGYEGDLVRHEVFEGTADRKTSKATGYWVLLCTKHHALVHANEEFAIRELKKPMQKAFEEEHSPEEFQELYHKNYL